MTQKQKCHPEHREGSFSSFSGNEAFKMKKISPFAGNDTKLVESHPMFEITQKIKKGPAAP